MLIEVDTSREDGKPLALGDAVELVIAELKQQRYLAHHTQVRTFGLINRFVTFTRRGFGVEMLDEVASEHVAAFVTAVTAQGSNRPSVATMRLRRWAVRLFFRIAREQGLTNADPTLDVRLPGRTNHTPRPLTSREVEHCRAAALLDLRSTRLAVAWALGEATARTAEIPHLRVGDLDLAEHRIWIHGSAQTAPRYGELTEWGAQQLRRRLRELGPPLDLSGHLAQIGHGNRESRVSFSTQALRETLTRAGLANLDGVRPASLAGWAGVQVFAVTTRIEVVALALGVRSLDAAARLIDWNWQDPELRPPDG
jgi:integrase/recombinase XerC